MIRLSFFSAGLLLFGPNLRADLAPPAGNRGVTVCHVLESSRFAELVLVGGLGPSPVDRAWPGYDLQEVPTGSCLPSSYYSQYTIFAVPAAEWQRQLASAPAKGRLTGRKLSAAFGSPVGILTDRYGHGEVVVADNDPLQSRKMEWAVAGLRGGNPVLYVKRVRDTLRGIPGEQVFNMDPPAGLGKQP